MKQLFKVGDEKVYKRRVTKDDFAAFHGQLVHPVLSTFSLARDAEWTTRQFVLDMRDEDEEGIGTFVNVEHVSPAFEDEEITYTGRIQDLKGYEIICTVEAHAGDRLIAKAATGQKIFSRTKLNKILKKA